MDYNIWKDSSEQIIGLDGLVQVGVRTDMESHQTFLGHARVSVGQWSATTGNYAETVTDDGPGGRIHYFNAPGSEIGEGRHTITFSAGGDVVHDPPAGNDAEVVVANCQILSAPQYAIRGIATDLNGTPTRLTAQGVPDGGTFDWHLVDGPGTGSFEEVTPDREQVDFRGGSAGTVTGAAEYYQRNGLDAQCWPDRAVCSMGRQHR